MIDTQTLYLLATTITTFQTTANTLPEAERKRGASHLIEKIKNAVSMGAELNTAYEYAQQLTPFIESAPKPLEALNYQVWMALKQNYTPTPPPTIAQREQIDKYSKESDKIIDEVLNTVTGEEAQHTLIEERLSTLRNQVFGVQEPLFLLQ